MKFESEHIEFLRTVYTRKPTWVGEVPNIGRRPDYPDKQVEIEGEGDSALLSFQSHGERLVLRPGQPLKVFDHGIGLKPTSANVAQLKEAVVGKPELEKYFNEHIANTHTEF